MTSRRHVAHDHRSGRPGLRNASSSAIRRVRSSATRASLTANSKTDTAKTAHALDQRAAALTPRPPPSPWSPLYPNRRLSLGDS